MLRARHRLPLVATLVAVAASGIACAALGDANTTATPDPTPTPTPTPPPPPPPPPPPVTASGTHAVTTELDLTATNVLPDTAYDAIQHLERLRDDPAGELFALLEAAGVPLLDQLLDALPGAVEDELTGFINDAIRSHVLDGTSFGAAIDQILALADTALAECTLVSDLDVESDTHTLRAVRFDTITVDLSTVPADPLSILTDDAAVSTNADHLIVGEHTFGLAYGELALEAIDSAMMSRWGVDLRGALGLIVDCPAMAASVADECVLGVCVGHEQELHDLCEMGLDLVHEEIVSTFAEQRFDAIRLAHGDARMVDSDLDGTADALADGVWSAEIDVGLGLRETPATFTASRR